MKRLSTFIAWVVLGAALAAQVVIGPSSSTPTSGAGSGSVTSVGVAVPAALLTVSGTPVTASGTITLALGTRAANLVFAGPTSGGAATPTFRALVAADIPSNITIGDTQVAFGDGANTIGGDADLTYNKTTNVLTGVTFTPQAITFGSYSGFAAQTIAATQSTSGGGGERDLRIVGATSTNDYGGNVSLTAGNGGGGGAQGGSISIAAGIGDDDRGGNVTISSGYSTLGNAGSVGIYGQNEDGSSGNGNGGAVTIQAGAKGGSGTDGTLALVTQGTGQLVLTAPGGVVLSNGVGLGTDTNDATTAKIQAYDVDGTAYKTFATLTNGNTPTFTITPPAGGTVTLSGRLVANTGTPAVTNTTANSCGTTAATLAGNDNAGKVTVGATAGTSCTVTFNTVFTNAPSCSVSNETTANLSRATSTASTVILAGTFVAGDVLAYSCIGR